MMKGPNYDLMVSIFIAGALVLIVGGMLWYLCRALLILGRELLQPLVRPCRAIWRCTRQAARFCVTACTRWKRPLLVGIVAGILFAYFVWPTPWKVTVGYIEDEQMLQRYNRITGVHQDWSHGHWAYPWIWEDDDWRDPQK